MDVWVWIAIVFLVLLVGITVGVYVYYKYKASAPSGGGSNCNTTQWDKNCVYYLEKYADNTIITPTQPLYLGSFGYSQGAGPALCQPMWYAFRYVRQSDGGYGPLGPWTSAAIFAGSCNLPAAPSVVGTGQVPPAGNSQASVTYNTPRVVTTQPLDYPLYQGYVANIHRFVGPSPPPNGSDVGSTIIGSLEPISTNSYGFTSEFTDVLFNPNQNGGTTCPVQSC